MSKGDINTFRNEGGGGTFVINDTDLHTLNFETIQVTEATVIAVLKINGVSVLANYISTPANTIVSGVITAPYGEVFSEIQLTSGGIIVGKE